ncbi:2-aminoethylphosphonate ABC transporter substrate-binding protein, partial [Klebsiella pneumoniae]|nr:2-aminoethylphosphonate ABC transporter substrate-binding protein [Klebsiella pneumoniae]
MTNCDEANTMKLSRLALLSLFALTSSPVWADGVVTVYSADG